MPQIFDNIANHLDRALSSTLAVSEHADFCIGYFNLRGWKLIDERVETWRGGERHQCRVLVGMEALPQETLQIAYTGVDGQDIVDNASAIRIRRQAAQSFREQLTLGVPTASDESALRRLSAQLKTHRVVVKLYLRHRLHAKLYLLHRNDLVTPLMAFVGSSNLTFSGLRQQGELNVDVVEQDAAHKLQAWFDQRWSDRLCVDISSELAAIIDESWARATQPPPYHIYLKMAYHLSQEARAGIDQFTVPRDLRDRLLPFQSAAVKIAAHHLNQRRGVMIGDVVGLGKTLMASTLARVFQEDHGTSTLIVCPPHLSEMWRDYVHTCRLLADIVPTSQVIERLPDMRRHRVVLVDESQNFRNPERKGYRALKDYIARNESRCILVSATPYNKSYSDLAAQLRLFLQDDVDLGIRPERYIKEIGDIEFAARHQVSPRSIGAFAHSPYADDWRDLMRLYLVRRTRSFVRDNYADTDENGRPYLSFESGNRFYFPVRVPRTIRIAVDSRDPADTYARMLSPSVTRTINALRLPRYGLGAYEAPKGAVQPSPAEEDVLRRLSRAGQRLVGFCRTGMFKRLESGGPAFTKTLERHVLRNYVLLHAIANQAEIPVGPQAADVLDVDTDADIDELNGVALDTPAGLRTPEDFQSRAAAIYDALIHRQRHRFSWIRASLFRSGLADDLVADSHALIRVLQRIGPWNPAHDRKMEALQELLCVTHRNEKVLVFTEFADTAGYIVDELRARGVAAVELATGATPDPTALAWRFSPKSNGKQEAIPPPGTETRVLVATDILSEGQNLQDAHIVVNYDLPWAIVRLIQRAGRIDRIGQTSPVITCYSFLPADGVERILNLRRRVVTRLRENAEVVGSDEAFFEDQDAAMAVDLYHEKAGVLDDDDESDVDLASRAYEIWRGAITSNPRLEQIIATMPDVTYSTKAGDDDHGPGVLVYVRTPEGSDALLRMNDEGTLLTESQLSVLDTAACTPETVALPRLSNHHDLVALAVKRVLRDTPTGGQLGRPSGARYRLYTRLTRYLDKVRGSLFEPAGLTRLLEEVYMHPLYPAAADALSRQMRSGIADEQLAHMAIALREDARLCDVRPEGSVREAQIICSLGLAGGAHA